MKKKILIVEDNEDMRFLYKRLFRRVGSLETSEVDRAESALEKMDQFQPDLVLIDISLPGINGLDLAEMLRRDFPQIKILIVTGHEVSRYHDEALKRGADDLVSKEIGKELIDRCLELLGLT